ncbi:MAG: phosphate-starvation-inducible PsiE family protein [Gaiellaceae bacterium]
MAIAREDDPSSSRQRLELVHRPLVVIDRVEALVHYAVASLLLVIAVIVLYRAVDHLIESRNQFAHQVADGINDLLLVVILMELLRTVVAHLETNDFHLTSFLIVGIVAAVRHLVGIGAQLTLTPTESASAFARSQVELGVSAGVVLALSIGFFLIGRSATTRRAGR